MAETHDLPCSGEVAWSQVAELVERHLGLHYLPARHGELERGIAAAARDFDQDGAAACAQWLLSNSWTNRHVDVLARHLAIGETYFFRDRGTFETIRDHVLPELLEARSDVRRLRVWSACCSTGEEAYSIAMLLRKSIPDIESWDISILASDVDPQALAKATRGVYGEWSFRDMPAVERAEFFSADGHGRYELDARVRRHVQFRRINLVGDAFPSTATGTEGLDIIFCRNVLMYFEQERALQVLGKLARCLRSDGWMFLNPVEVPHSGVDELTAVHFEKAIAHRKSPVFADDPVVFEAAKFAPAAFDARCVESPVAAARDQELPEATDLIRRARESADRGALEQARELCERALAADKLEASSHYLLANVLLELGLGEEAAGALRRTLYLQPNHALAHCTLGHLARKAGKSRDSMRHYRNALRAIDASAPQQIPNRFDGMDVARLAELIRGSMQELQ
jgi:chemotaxis protein methyltransferase CheR